MGSTDIAREIAALPPEAQKQVIEFLTFLKTRYPSAATARKARRTKLVNEPFVGMWRARRDLADSVAWVRELRRSDWGCRQ